MDNKDIELRLLALGVRITKCVRCGRPIFFVRTKTGSVAPVTMELKNHFIDCPFREEFRKPRAIQGA
jgi:hypothetical protein